MLNAHSRIRCHDEVLLKESGSHDAIANFVARKGLSANYRKKDYHGPSGWKKWRLYRDVEHRNSLVHANNSFVSELLEDFLNELHDDPHSGPWTSVDTWNDHQELSGVGEELAVGFKIMYYELQNPYLLDYVRRDDVHVVHLIRGNKLEKMVSTLLANARGSWHSESGASDGVKVELNPDHLVARIEAHQREVQRWADEFRGEGYIEVYYEDFRNDMQSVADKVFNALGVPSEQVSTPLKKVSSDLEDSLSNYEEVKQALADTPHAAFLNSGQ